MKNRILLNEVSGIVTTDRGLEPLLTESESAVLPLHQSAILLSVTKLCFLFHRQNRVFPVIGVTGFEPAASTSRT